MAQRDLGAAIGQPGPGRAAGFAARVTGALFRGGGLQDGGEGGTPAVDSLKAGKTQQSQMHPKMHPNRFLAIFPSQNQSGKNARSGCAAGVSFGERGGTRTLDPMIKSHGGKAGSAGEVDHI